MSVDSRTISGDRLMKAMRHSERNWATMLTSLKKLLET
jgi:hypothetical protein